MSDLRLTSCTVSSVLIALVCVRMNYNCCESNVKGIYFIMPLNNSWHIMWIYNTFLMNSYREDWKLLYPMIAVTSHFAFHVYRADCLVLFLLWLLSWVIWHFMCIGTDLRLNVSHFRCTELHGFIKFVLWWDSQVTWEWLSVMFVMIGVTVHLALHVHRADCIDCVLQWDFHITWDWLGTVWYDSQVTCHFMCTGLHDRLGTVCCDRCHSSPNTSCAHGLIGLFVVIVVTVHLTLHVHRNWLGTVCYDWRHRSLGTSCALG